MQTNLNELRIYRGVFKKCENQLDLLSKEMSLIREAETLGSAMGSHQLATISARYAIYRKTRDEFDAARNQLVQKADESEASIQAYRQCLETLKTGAINEHQAEVDALSFAQIQSEFKMMRDFLESSAQSQLYAQCEQTRYDLDAAILQQITLVRKTFDDIQQYGAIVKYFPQAYHENHRFHRFAQWSRFLVEQKTVQACRDVVLQYEQQLGVNAAKPVQQFLFGFAEQLRYTLDELNFKINRTRDRLSEEFDAVAGDDGDQQETLCDEARSTLELFLQNDEKGSLNCVTVTALCDINKRFLMMETAAASSGENLVDLTTNGKWFLDELFLFSTLQTNICQIITGKGGEEPPSKSYLAILYALNRLYACFRSMNEKFTRDILPRSIEGIIAEDRSILDAISAVSNLQPPALADLQNSLGIHLHCAVRGVASPNGTIEAMAVVETLKTKLRELFDNFEVAADAESSPGKRLLLDLNQLFKDLEGAHAELMLAIDGATIVSNLELDQVKGAHDLAAHVFNRTVRLIVQNVFVLKRLDVMIEFFGLCLQIAYAFKGSAATAVCDDDRLLRPIRKYIADRIQVMGLGIGPYAVAQLLCQLIEAQGIVIADEISRNERDVNKNPVYVEELCRKGLEAAMKKGQINGAILAKASTLCATYDDALRKRETFTTLQWTLDHQSTALNRIQLMATAHSWIHDEILMLRQPAVNYPTLTRTNLVLIQMKSNVTGLLAWQAAIKKMRDEMIALSVAAGQRLKWAAGANPSLTEILHNFEQMTAIKQATLERSSLLAATALSTCRALYAYETGRSLLDETRDLDQIFLNCVSRWEKSVMMAKSSAVAVSPVEEALVELLDPEGPIDGVWLANVKCLVNEMTEQTEEEMDAGEKRLVTSQDDLQKSGHKLQLLIGVHHQISADLFAMLKLTLKHGHSENNERTRGYLMQYKRFMETVVELQGLILSKDFTEETIVEIEAHTKGLLVTIGGVFENLFWFGSDAVVGEQSTGDGGKPERMLMENHGDGDPVGVDKREDKGL